MLIDFNKIMLMPETLNIENGSMTNMALDYYVINRIGQSGAAAVAAELGDYAHTVYKRLPETLARQHSGIDDRVMPSLLKHGEQYFNNIQNYGVPTWYEWRIQNWGTKWNAYDQSRDDENTIEFLTAWSGAPKLMERLSEQFPDLSLSYIYADEAWGNNVGEYEYESGECVYEHRPPNGSEEARGIAEELLGPREWDVEEENGDEGEGWDDEL